MSSLNFECPECGAGPLRFCKAARAAGVGEPRVWDSCSGRLKLSAALTARVDTALTLWQPWSWVIAHGGALAKRIENRDWPPPESIIGKRLAIHAGMTTDVDAVDYLTAEMGFDSDMLTSPRGKRRVTSMSRARDVGDDEYTVPLVNGAFESVGTVLGAVHTSGKTVGMSGITELAVKLIRCDPYFSGEWGWFLVDVVTLPKPIACKGSRQLWAIPGPERIAIAEQLRGLA